MSQPQTKMVEWPTLATFHDPRSSPDAVPWGRWRLVENMATVDGDWRRRAGWRRFGHWMSLPDTADLRSPPDGATDPIRALYVHVSPSGHRRLFAASGSIYSQLHDGRWRTLYTGVPGERYQFASVGDRVFATNSETTPKCHVLDSSTFADIPDLETIGLSRAGMVVAWKGILFFGDVVMDHVRIGHRVVWSDLESPMRFEPTTDSIAGFQDLDPGETILAGIPMGDNLYLFTTLSIWRVTVVGGEAYLSFQQVYHDRNGAGCLAARYSIAVWKDTAIYVSREGIQTFGSYSAVPDQPSWMFHATAGLETGDLSKCREISVAIRARDGELWVSYPSGSSEVANRTVVLNLNYQSSDEVDHGFTAMLSGVLDDSMEVIEWLRVKVGCSSASINALFPPTDGEVRPTFDGTPQTIEEFCADESNFPECTGCPSKERFLAVSATDGAIKSIEDDYFARDQWTGVAYEAVGYGSRWVTGALHFGNTNWKRVSEIVLGLLPVASVTPRTLNLTVSTSGNPGDVLAPVCTLRSFPMKSRSIACPATAVSGTQPNAHFRWPVLVEGRYLYLDFSVPAAVGGAFSVSRLAVQLGASPNTTL